MVYVVMAYIVMALYSYGLYTYVLFQCNRPKRCLAFCADEDNLQCAFPKLNETAPVSPGQLGKLDQVDAPLCTRPSKHLRPCLSRFDNNGCFFVSRFSFWCVGDVSSFGF